MVVSRTGLAEAFHRPLADAWQTRERMARHGLDQLTDRDGSPVALCRRRLRKTVKSQQYLRVGGVLPDFATGHSRQVAAAHYADIEAHRPLHEQAVEDGLREALQVALPPPVVIDQAGRRLDDGTDPLADRQVQQTLSGHSDVFLASCTDFYASPFARTYGTACPVPIWGCLECPNAVYTTRHLPSVLAFLGFVDYQRDRLPADEWQARYQLSRQRILDGILPKFTSEQVITARAIAEAGGPLLSLPAQILEHTT